MNLFDCHIPYFTVPLGVVELSGRRALLSALQICREDSTASLIAPQGARHKERKLADIRFELQRHGLITDRMELPEIEKAERVTLPRDCNYESLSIGTLKTLIACYARARYSRESFRFVCTQDVLAREAHLSPQSLRDALRQLEANRLIGVEKIWRDGTRITLLDPECGSGCPLYYLGQFYKEQLEHIPIPDRYKTCLKQYDPKQHLENINGPVENYAVMCPFCERPDPKGTLRFSSTEENDHWHCHKCKRAGNSVRLWVRLQWRIGKDDWRSLMANMVPSAGIQDEVNL